MGPLAEYLKNEADHLRAEEGAQREEAKAEWLEALERLYNQLEQWALEADGGLRLLRVDRPVGEYVEPRLGVYDIRILRLRLGSRSVRVTPLARYVIAAIRPLQKELTQRPDGMSRNPGFINTRNTTCFVSKKRPATRGLFRELENGTGNRFLERWSL